MEQAITLTLKTIFPTEKNFNDYIVNELKLTGDFQIFITPYIYYFYVNSNVCYDTDEAFKRQFGITMKNIFRHYNKEHEIIEQIYSLNDKELSIMGEVVNVVSNNDNSKVIDPLDNVLEFVSGQNISRQTTNKLKAFYETIDKLSDDVIEEFIDTLRKHFVTVLQPYSYYYCSKEE